MKTLNVKKVALVVAGAVLLGSSLAFAGGISYQNVPIVNNAGQPVVTQSRIIPLPSAIFDRRLHLGQLNRHCRYSSWAG